MTAPSLPPAEIKRRLKVWRQYGGNSVLAAEALSISRPTLQHSIRAARRLGLTTQVEMDQSAQRAMKRVGAANLTRDRQILQERVDDLERQIDRMRTARPVRPVRVRAKRQDEFVRVVIPDSHGSHADPAAIGAFLQDLKALSPHEIVMLGDHVDCGGFLAQHHTLGYVAETSYTYEDDIASANAFLDDIMRAAPRARIHYIEGNHEARVEKWCVTMCLRSGRDAEGMRQRNAPEFLLRLKDRGIPYYRRSVRYDCLPIPGCIKLGKTFFTHEPGRGGRPEGYARSFGGCVIFGHEHRARGAVVRTVAAGEIGVWCPGTLAVQQPYWMHTQLTDHTHGYLVQHVARSGGFLAINVPIIGGVSHLRPLLHR